MTHLRLVFAGTPEPAVVALDRLLDSDHEVLAVITRPDARRGRGRTLHPSPVAARAAERGIEVLKPATLKPGTEDGDALRARLAELAPDALPVVAYGNLITPDLLDVAEHGWVNLHFSLLPRWRGAAPVQASIAAGDAETGASTFRIAAGLDTGDVLAQIHEPIGPEDTADDLLTRLAYSGADLLAETMDGLAAGTITARPQAELGGEPTHAAKITSADARIDWTRPTAETDRVIRAHTPAPGAWTMWGERRMKLGRVVPLTADSEAAAPVAGRPGVVHAGRHSVVVGTADAAVELTRIQPPGKKAMAAEDWARGALPGTTDEEQGVTFQ